MCVSIHASVRTNQRFKQVQRLLEQLDPEAPPQALVVPGSPVLRGSIVVFPGSFNPPTTAHLALLRQARGFAPLSPGEADQAMHLYAAISKHTIDKETVERPLLLDRVMLLDWVLHHHLRDTGLLLFNRGLYVEEAQAVRACFPEVTRLFFLIGFDKIVQILDPRYYKDRDAALHELFELADLLVAPRGVAGADALEALLSQSGNRQFARHIHALPLSTAYRTISSTSIRQNPDTHLDEVPPEVQRFIRETHAYTPPRHLPDGTLVDDYAERVKALAAILKKAHRDP